MKLFEISVNKRTGASMWSIQFTHPALLTGGTIFDQSRSFLSLDEALAHMISAIKQLAGEHLDTDNDEARQHIDYWNDVTVDDLKSQPDLGAYAVEQQGHTGIEYWYDLGFVDGDVALIHGSPESPNKDEISRQYDDMLPQTPNSKPPTIN